DGYVDGVNVIYAGTFDGTPQTIWPHAWSLPGGGRDFDGVTVYSFSVQNEFESVPGDKPANTLCHEFGHVMGLPDLYDYDYDSFGIGYWGMMSFGVHNDNGWNPAHLCAWSRIGLGILSPVNVTASGFYDVPSVEESGTVYRLWTGGSGGNEYYLVENRRPIGYDSHLPGHGILIWHVDDSQNSNDNQWYPGYTSYGNYRVALEQADGLWQMEQYINGGDAGDPFPGPSGQNADTFNYWTIPDSRDYDFLDTYVEISSIPESADTVSVFMSVSQTGIEEGSGQGNGNYLELSSNPVYGSVTITLTHGGGKISLAVFDLSGRRVSTLTSGPLQPGQHSFSWNTESLPKGIYSVRYTGEKAESESSFLIL
ncbi:MAG: M6 family metalloprotease domain-containing protein, partial [Candidatus Aegiribacteria sp.]|nr:M6 family metalloprotease domain-containing protein [Candidatus Aegiribacteria sp.]